jgi:hypothetical protein
MLKYTLKRAKGKNRIEQITEKFEDRTLLQTRSDIISDEMAKVMLKHGDWRKEEVRLPDGTSYIQMVKKIF